MHRIAVISDTHNLLRPEVLEIIKTCEVIVHAGDISTFDILEQLKELKPLFIVRGNNDRGDWASDLPHVLHFDLFGRKVCMTHIKRNIPQDPDADLVIYGHSHRYSCAKNGDAIFLNPGSCGPRRFNQEITMAVLTLYEEGETAGEESTGDTGKCAIGESATGNSATGSCAKDTGRCATGSPAKDTGRCATGSPAKDTGRCAKDTGSSATGRCATGSSATGSPTKDTGSSAKETGSSAKDTGSSAKDTGSSATGSCATGISTTGSSAKNTGISATGNCATGISTTGSPTKDTGSPTKDTGSSTKDTGRCATGSSTTGISVKDCAGRDMYIERIDIPHETPVGKGGSRGAQDMKNVLRTTLGVSSRPYQSSRTYKRAVTIDLIRRVCNDIDRERTVEEIATRRGIDKELAEQITRMYLTHQRVTPEEIMTKLGL